MARKIMNGVDGNGQRAQNFADPQANTDLVTMQWAQNLLRGLVIKDAVRVASTANITITSPGATIDGVTMAVNDRFLAKDQTTGAEKGIYQWNGAAVAATRTLDADNGTELRPGTIVYVTEGTTNADKAFAITSDAAITIGTTAHTWSIFGGGTTYTGGNGINVTGATIAAVAAAGGGIVVTASGIGVDTSKVPYKAAANIGNGAATAIAITHNLGTQDVVVQMREVATQSVVDTDWVATDTNNVTFTFPAAPTTGQFRCIIMG